LAIDFTESFFDYGYLTIVTAAGSRVYSPLAVIWPFDAFLWFLIFMVTICAFGFFSVIIKAIYWLGLGESESLKFARRGKASDKMWTFKYQFQFILTSFLDQDTVLPIFSPLRCFVSIWLFFTLVLTTIYRTKLVSFMAFPLMAETPNDFDELAYSGYAVGFMKHGDSAYNTLAASTDPVYVKLINEMEVIEGYGLECLDNAVKGSYGCIGYDYSFRHLLERNLSAMDASNLKFTPAHTYNIYYGISFEGKSIFRVNFGYWLSFVRPMGLHHFWEATDVYYTVRLLKRKWWEETGQSEKASLHASTDDDNLTLKHISGSFYILLILLAVCTCVFFGEVLHFNRDNILKGIQEMKNFIKTTITEFWLVKRSVRFLKNIPVRKNRTRKENTSGTRTKSASDQRQRDAELVKWIFGREVDRL
jgi:hypothetical protein